MRRRFVIAPLAGLVLFGADARDACAQDSAVLPTTPSTPEASGSVRVRVRLQREKDVADVLVERGGTWTVVCRAPCTFDATPGERVRVDLQGIIDEPLAFTVVADGAEVQDIEVRRRGNGFLVGGLVAIGAGAISLALGAAILRSADDQDLFGELNRSVARIAVLLGATSAAAGTILIVNRSHAPVLASSPQARSQALEDLSPTRSMGAAELRIAPPQLVWTRSF